MFYFFRKREECDKLQDEIDRLRRLNSDLSEFYTKFHIIEREKTEIIFKYNELKKNCNDNHVSKLDCTKLQEEIKRLEDMCEEKKRTIWELQDSKHENDRLLVSLDMKVKELTKENIHLKYGSEKPEEYSYKRKTVEQGEQLFKYRDTQEQCGYSIFKPQSAGYSEKVKQRSRYNGDRYKTTRDCSNHSVTNARTNVTDENKMKEERDTMEAALKKKEAELESMRRKCVSLENENDRLSNKEEIIRKQEQQMKSLKGKNAQLESDCLQKQTNIDNLLAKLHHIGESQSAFQRQEIKEREEHTRQAVESMKTKQKHFEEKTRNQEYIIDKKTKKIEEMRTTYEVMSLKWNASKQKNYELEKKVKSMETEIAALQLKAKMTDTDKTERKVKLVTKLQSLEDQLGENRKTLRDVYQAKSELENLNGDLVRENKTLKEETENLKSKLIKLETFQEQLTKENVQTMQTISQEKEAQHHHMDTLKQEVKRLQSKLERKSHDIEAARQHTAILQSGLQKQTTLLETERENSDNKSSVLEKLENNYDALLAERKASELKAKASGEQLKRDLSEAKRLEEHLKVELKRTCAEKDMLQNKVADAKQTVSEYRRKEADIRYEKEDQSSEIDRLNQELEKTRRELDTTNLRYEEICQCYYLQNLLLHF